jgi:membrane protein YqaA with SNARE-associated domain
MVTSPLAVSADPSVVWALLAVFVTCAVAGSVVPVSSEVAVATAAVAGVPVAPLVVVATAGNVLGACVNYATGRLGATWWRKRRGWQRADPTNENSTSRLERRARAWVSRWGAPAMVLSWLPVVGDPLTVVAGAVGVGFGPFVAWVTFGKAARYAVVVWATGAIPRSFGW